MRVSNTDKHEAKVVGKKFKQAKNMKHKRSLSLPPPLLAHTGRIDNLCATRSFTNRSSSFSARSTNSLPNFLANCFLTSCSSATSALLVAQIKVTTADFKSSGHSFSEAMRRARSWSKSQTSSRMP